MNRSALVNPTSMQRTYERFHFAAAAKTKDLLLCSGQLGLGPDGRAIVDPPAQFAAAFDAVLAVLAEAGLDLGDVVEITTFHVGLLQHLAAFARVKDGYMAEPYPAWTAIGVSELAVPGALGEIRAIAQLRKSAECSKPAKTRAPKQRAAKQKTARRR